MNLLGGLRMDLGSANRQIWELQLELLFLVHGLNLGDHRI